MCVFYLRILEASKDPKYPEARKLEEVRKKGTFYLSNRQKSYLILGLPHHELGVFIIELICKKDERKES